MDSLLAIWRRHRLRQETSCLETALQSQHAVDPRVAWETPMDGVELELGCVSTVDKRHRLSPSPLGLSQCLFISFSAASKDNRSFVALSYDKSSSASRRCCHRLSDLVSSCSVSLRCQSCSVLPVASAGRCTWRPSRVDNELEC